MIQTVTNRFRNPPKRRPADIYAERYQRQGPKQLFICPINMNKWREEECDFCLSFVTTCDLCHAPGHCESPGWNSIKDKNEQPFVLCMDCYEMVDSKEDID